MRSHLGLKIKAACADSAYGTSLIYRTVSDMGIRLYTPGATGGTTYKVELKREESDICRIYRADRKDCRVCQMSGRYISNSQRSRTIRVNIFEEAVKKQRERDGTPFHRNILKLRQIWCEGSFAAQKASHNLRVLYRRGIEAAEEHCLLSAMALNLKRMVKCLS